jgi:hypothetical protein
MPWRLPTRRLFRRHYAVQTPRPPALAVFDHGSKWLQKERAAADVPLSRSVDYLRDEAASRLCDRLLVSRAAQKGATDPHRTSSASSPTS